MSDDKMDRIELGRRIQQLREYHGFSQADVASYLGTSRSTISLIESGNRKLYSIELKKLAALFGLGVDDLLSDSGGGDQEKEAVKLLARATADLEPDDREEVLRFAEFLRARKKKGASIDEQ